MIQRRRWQWESGSTASYVFGGKAMAGEFRRLRWDTRSAELFISALLSCAVGCGGGDPQQTAAEARSGVARRAAEDRSLLEPGAASVEFYDQLLTVQSNRALRLAVVERVAEAAGFEVAASRVEPQTLTVRIERAPLEAALPILLGDLPYAVEYVFDPERRAHVLVKLRAGKPDPPAVAATPPEATTSFEAGATVSVNQSPPPPIDDPSIEDLRYQIEELGGALDETFDRSASENSRVRADAILELPLAGEGLDVVLDALALDSDPEVRAAAAQRLAAGRGFAATAGLVDALNDPAPEVTLQAVDSLVAIGDRSVLWDLKDALGQTSDPRLQRALQEAIQTLQSNVGMLADGDAGGGEPLSAPADR
jgi:hypothetical protein